MRKKKKHNKRSKRVTYNKNIIRELVLQMFRATPKKTWNYKQVAAKLSIKDPEIKKLINTVLTELTEDNLTDEVSRGKFRLKKYDKQLTGQVYLSASGAGFVETDELSKDIFIKKEKLKGALHGDTVKVSIIKNNTHKNPEGRVIEIVKRLKDHFVGIVNMNDGYAFLELTERNANFDIFIPPKNINGAKHGEKAIAKVTDFNSGRRNLEGTIVEVLGKPQDNEVEMHAILAEFGLPYRYPELPVQEAEKISANISKSEISKRKDFREITTFTIDPEDAKDFDDAISYRKLLNGNIELGVHIADVSHYVKEGSVLDEEAYQRGTSIYLPDRTVPMLPERISNFICSLRPNEEKLCYSAVFELDNEAAVKNEWFGRTVIKSDRRFTYEEAQTIIETSEGDFANEILELQKLAEKLRKKRFEQGSIAFERSEMRFELDETGKPLNVLMKISKEANKLIEEFMLLANRRVASMIARKNSGKYAQNFVYRIHEDPDFDKLVKFSNFVTNFGYNCKFNSTQKVATKLNKFLEEIRGDDMQNVIELLAVQSMAKARYTTQNCGHFGLSFNFYTHFTSPIRRYPDLLVHRLLTRYLANENPVDNILLEAKCKHSSMAENLAVTAERAAIKYKQVEFLKDKMGFEYDASIIGVSESGLFVALDISQIEGFVSVNDMNDDYYDYIEDKFCMKGSRTGKIYSIGDKIHVQLIRADLIKRRLDFQIKFDTKN